MILDESLAAEIKNEPTSAAAKEARKLGLSYAGFGRYIDKKGKIAYIVDRGRLVPYKTDTDLAKMREKTLNSPKKPAAKKPGDKTPQKDEGKELEKLVGATERNRAKENKFHDKTKRETYKVNDALNKHHQELYANLNDKQKEALQSYTDIAFEHINKYLYKGHDEGATASQDRWIANMIGAIDSVIDQSEAPFSYTVYSGLSKRYTPDKIMPGQKYLFRGYMSTSLDPTTAIAGFTNEDKNKQRVVLQIEITGGQKALHLDNLSLNSGGEMETLLPRGSMIQVVSGPHMVKADGYNVSSNKEESDIYLFHCLLHQEDDE